MAALQTHLLLSSSSSSSKRRSFPNLHSPTNLRTYHASLPKPPTTITREVNKTNTIIQPSATASNHDKNLLSKLMAIAEAAADRAEMHDIIGVQRDNWNTLFLNSLNSITLTASIMASVSAIPIHELSPHSLPLKLSSSLLFFTATCIMLLVNKIQPSQLAEEQRNATRLFRQLERSIRATMELQNATEGDVDEAVERVLALDKAYPLPLLPGMLEKFPNPIKPTVWWPKSQLRRRQREQQSHGWSDELEDEMKSILRVLKTEDEEQYMWFANTFVDINRSLAISGPILGGLAAIGAGLIGTPGLGQWPEMVAVVAGTMATTVNTVEHGAQIGMLFEMFRNCAGYYRRLEEEIEVNLEESELEKREDGELFELKMALQLGRSVADMRSFARSAAYGSCEDGEVEEFAGKLF